MKIRTSNLKTKLWPLCILGGALVLSQVRPASAQSTITPGGNGRFYVELKDATLADALEMIFKASGNPAHIIDESAKQVKIGSISYPNIAPDNVIRQLANDNNFLVKKNSSGATVIEPRAPVVQPGNPGMPGMMPGAPGMPGAPVPGGRPAVPANPFGVSLEGGAAPTTLAYAQFGGNNRGGNNRGGNNRGGNNRGGNSRNRTEFNKDGKYQLLIVRHVYAGGIARLFVNGDVIPTELLVYPESALVSGSNSSGGGSSVSGFGSSGGSGGIGGGSGGFGGSSGGIGGGSGGIGGGGGIGISDRNLKENFSLVNSASILDRVASLPIQEWNYKQQDAAIRHIGPMAQDFAAAFGVGEDDRRINFIDANGVSLASIQALYKLTQQQSEQIATLQKQVEALQNGQPASKNPVTVPQLSAQPVVTPQP